MVDETFEPAPVAIPPTTATTTEKHETVTTTGDATQAAVAAQVAMAPRFDDWVRAILSCTVVGGFLFVVIYGQITGKYPPDGITTTYVGFVMLSLGFYLGSSYGSNNKDKAAKTA